jgi:prevent-host-death family protein
MKRASVSEAKNQLSALLDRVRHGESVLITDRDQPVAQLVPAGSALPAQDRLQDLVRRGVVRAGHGGAAPGIADQAPPVPTGGADVLAALQADRDEGP